MMQLLSSAFSSAFKSLLQRVWSWCRQFWQVILGATIPVFLWLIFRKRTGPASPAELLDRVREDHRRDLDAIGESHRIEGALVQDALERRESTVAQIEQQYSAAQVELDSKKRDKIRDLVEQYGDDPDELTSRLAQATGVRVWTGDKK